MNEKFRPLKHLPPDSLINWLRFNLRLLIDFQVLTVYRDLRDNLPKLSGRIVDIGAGESPYRHLINVKNAEYIGIDAEAAEKFGYHRPDVKYYYGDDLPFESASVDHFFCTEVLEHAEKPEKLIGEMFRILKPGGSAIITVPWSTRYHYIPVDYYRFTPSALKAAFSLFARVEIKARGTDITVIAAKVVAAYFRMFRNAGMILLDIPLILLFLPLTVLAVIIGQMSVWFNWGSADDPLGYTVRVIK